jgi:hypothetical protein
MFWIPCCDEDLSPRMVYPVIYVTDGLWIRRNKSLYSRMVAPLLISISNDTSYGTDNEVYLIREKQGHVNIIGERSSIEQTMYICLLRFPSSLKLTTTITEILLKVALNTINQTNQTIYLFLLTLYVYCPTEQWISCQYYSFPRARTLFFVSKENVGEYDLMQYLQVRLLDRQRYSKYEDLSPRMVYPVIYVTDGLWIRRNKSLSFLHGKLLILLVVCVLFVFMFWIPCFDVRNDFRIKTMFGCFRMVVSNT